MSCTAAYNAMLAQRAADDKVFAGQGFGQGVGQGTGSDSGSCSLGFAPVGAQQSVGAQPGMGIGMGMAEQQRYNAMLQMNGYTDKPMNGYTDKPDKDKDKDPSTLTLKEALDEFTVADLEERLMRLMDKYGTKK
jgi:hypothetical protein